MMNDTCHFWALSRVSAFEFDGTGLMDPVDLLTAEFQMELLLFYKALKGNKLLRYELMRDFYGILIEVEWTLLGFKLSGWWYKSGN